MASRDCLLDGGVSPQFDSAYCRRLSEGDAEITQHFFAYFSPLLLAKLRRRVRSAALIEEIRQETFLRTFRVLRSPDGLRQPEHLGAFLNGVCENTIREYLRADSRTLPLAEDADRRPGSLPSPEGELITGDRKRMVRAVLEQLRPRDRTILKALFLEERDKEEVCRELGINRATLRVLLHRAKSHFRAILGAKDSSAL